MMSVARYNVSTYRPGAGGHLCIDLGFVSYPTWNAAVLAAKEIAKALGISQEPSRTIPDESAYFGGETGWHVDIDMVPAWLQVKGDDYAVQGT